MSFNGSIGKGPTTRNLTL